MGPCGPRSGPPSPKRSGWWWFGQSFLLTHPPADSRCLEILEKKSVLGNKMPFHIGLTSGRWKKEPLPLDPSSHGYRVPSDPSSGTAVSSCAVSLPVPALWCLRDLSEHEEWTRIHGRSCPQLITEPCGKVIALFLPGLAEKHL